MVHSPREKISRSDDLKVARKCGAGRGPTITRSSLREEDVLDVWFDSGSSQAAVPRPASRNSPGRADAYLEAVEQARGWFRLIARLRPSPNAVTRPFAASSAHGLTVDEQGRKMSKSLGNSEDAADTVNRYGRRCPAPRVCLARLHHRKSRSGPDHLHRGRRVLSQDSQHVPLSCWGNLYDFDPRGAIRSRRMRCWNSIATSSRANRTPQGPTYSALTAPSTFRPPGRRFQNFRRRRSELAVYRRRAPIGCTATPKIRANAAPRRPRSI